MTKNPARLVLAALVAAAPATLVVSTLSPTPSGTSAAEYCVYNGATYVLGREVVPAGRYCVPGP